MLQKSLPPAAGSEAIRVTSRAMRILAVFFVLFLAAENLAAQGGKRQERAPRGGQQMSQEERQRMREDMRDAYRERWRRPERQREMSPQERDKLRQDIQDANRELRRP